MYFPIPSTSLVQDTQAYWNSLFFFSKGGKIILIILPFLLLVIVLRSTTTITFPPPQKISTMLIPLSLLLPGLLNALVVHDDTEDGGIAWRMCMEMKNRGLLAKPTHGHIIRLAPPLCITEQEVYQALDIIEASVKRFS